MTDSVSHEKRVQVRRQSSRAVQFLRFCILSFLLVVGLLPAFHYRLGGVFPDISIPLTEIKLEKGFAFYARIPGEEFRANAEPPSVRLYENGVELATGNSRLEEIQEKGSGRYFAWRSQIYFSTPDNSDPRTNGRLYYAHYNRSVPFSIVLIGGFLSFLSLVFLVRGVRLRHALRNEDSDTPAPFVDPNIVVVRTPTTRGVFHTVYILIVSVVLALGLAEGVLRIADSKPNELSHRAERASEPSLPLVWNNRISWIFRPGSEFSYRDRREGTRGDEVLQQVNEFGFLDRAPRKPVDSASVRVMLFGDGFVEALGVRMDRKVGPLLERILQRNGRAKSVDVLSFGRTDTSQATQYSYWKEFGSQFKPHVVVLLISSRDLRNNHPEIAARFYGWNVLYPPRFSVALSNASPHGLLDIPPFSGWEEFSRVSGETSAPPVSLSWLFARSALVQFFRQRNDSRMVLEPTYPPEQMYRGKFVDEAFLDPALQEAPEIKAGYTITRRLLDRFATEVRAQGGEIVLFAVDSLQLQPNDEHRTRISFFESWVAQEAKRIHALFGSMAAATSTTHGEESIESAAAEALGPLVRKALRSNS